MSRGGRGGRGRGRGKPFGNALEALGLPPGESAPPPILQPPPLFPALERRPLELKSSDVEDYLVSIKQELKRFMIHNPFHLKASFNTVEIARYSDKYKTNGEKDKGMGWDINWMYFPEELKLKKKKKKKRPSIKMKSSKSGGNTKKKRTIEDAEEIMDDSGEGPNPKKSKTVTWSGDEETEVVKKLETLEKSELLSVESEQSEEEDNNPEPLYNDEEDDEEGTDYNLTYFDNGEDDEMRDDEALEEGPIY